MVCKTCEKVGAGHQYLLQSLRLRSLQKLSTVAAPDPFKPSSSTRKIGENKLLSARAKAAPYIKPGPGGSSKGAVNPYGNKCIDCKVRAARSRLSRARAYPASARLNRTRRHGVKSVHTKKCVQVCMDRVEADGTRDCVLSAANRSWTCLVSGR